MSRDAENRAKAANDRQMNLSKQYGADSDTLFGKLVPMYSTMATNPTGMTRQELNDTRTSSMQSAGGSVSGATGQANLDVARTGNAGGYAAALADAARKGIATNADNALKTNMLNTTLKEQQREQGIAGLQGLQTSRQSAGLNALGQTADSINAEVNAGNSGWFQNMLGLMNAGANAATGAARLRNR